MLSSLTRRVVSLFAVFAIVALAIAPGVTADTNVAPTVFATVSNPNPGEPQTVFASATFTDPESATETYTCAIYYGDNTPLVAGAVSGMTCTGPAHSYRVTGNYAILVTVTDSGGAQGAWLTGANYTNYPPILGPVGYFGATEIGRAAHVLTPFTDSGYSLDPGAETYACTVDYGDGSGAQAGTWVPVWNPPYAACVGPDHIYQLPGTYTIKVVVTDSGGAASSATTVAPITAPVSPTVTAPPDQSVTSQMAAPYSGWYPYSLGSFSDPGGASAGPWYWYVEWDGVLGRSGTATAQGPLTGAQYLLPGTHRAHVVVRNAAGKTGDAYFNVTVAGDLYVGTAPMVVATEGVPTSVLFGFYDPYLVQSTSYTVHIDFGDGTSHNFSADNYTPMPMSIPHTYAAADATPSGAPGTMYTATVTVTDSLGHSGSATRLQPVNDVAPVVTALPQTVPQGFSGPLMLATFSDASVGPWYVLIDQGQPTEVDEQVQSPGEIQLPYFNTNFGDHTFTVSVWDRGGLHSAVTVTVTIANQTPVVSQVYFTPSPALEGTHVALVATYYDPRPGDHAYTCSIDYGDGSVPQAGTIVGSQCYGPAHLYPGLGPYTATVWVYSNVGYGTGTATLILPNDPPAISSYSIPASTTLYEANLLTATFTDRGSQTSETYTCTVDGGDGSGPQPGDVHGSTCQGYVGYDQTGTYTATIRITDSNGGVATQSAQISVYLTAPVVNEISVPATVTAGVPIAASATFVATGRAETYTCTVNYDDGTGPQAGTIVGSTCQGPTHVYALPGYMTVAVVVTGSQSGPGGNTTDIVVFLAAPAVGPVQVPQPAFEGTWVMAWVNFVPTGLSEEYTCTVDYGDGTPPLSGVITGTVCQGTSHSYSQTGTYTVTMAVVGSVSGPASANAQITISIPPIVSAIHAPDTVIIGSPIAASADFVPSDLPATYTCLVDYGDGGGQLAGVVAGSNCQGPSHAYTTRSTYNILFYIIATMGGGGSITVLGYQTIHVQLPPINVGAVSAPDKVAVRSAVSASAAFIPSGAGQTYSCKVDYGDGTFFGGVVSGSTCKGPSHVYLTTSSYFITVTVTSSSGANGWSGKWIAVVTPAPVVGPISTPSSIVEGSSFSASAGFTTIGAPQTYTCTVDYGDGSGPLAGVITGTTCQGPKRAYGYAGIAGITVIVKGSSGYSGSAYKEVSIADVPPTITKLTAPSTVKLGTSVAASVIFTDPGFAETHRALWDWGDGTQTDVPIAAGVKTASASHTYAKAGSYGAYVMITGSTYLANFGVAVYDPARTLSASGSAVSPKGACLLTPQCGVAGTAGFSISASYAKNATKPTVNLAYSVTGISITANSADYFLAVNGTALISGKCTVNGKTGYNYSVWLVDGRPDTLSLFVFDNNGNWIYFTDPAPLKSGSITIK